VRLADAEKVGTVSGASDSKPDTGNLNHLQGWMEAEKYFIATHGDCVSRH